MGKLVKGFRAGVLFHTTAGSFRNGSEPSPKQAADLKAQGYTLEKTRDTLDAAVPIASGMRSEQIEADETAQLQSNLRADDIARAQAATLKAPQADETSDDDAERDKHSQE